MPAPKMIKKGEHDARNMLLALGVGHYNATIMIQYMFLSPSATDPAMPSIMLMTKHLQAGLRAAGARVPLSGVIDAATAKALIRLVGPEWNHVTWYGLFEAVTYAKRERTLEKRTKDLPLDGVGIVDLPAIPGGMLTWAAAGVAAYLLLRKKKH